MIPPRIGRYELVTCLGRGGMGEVWEAVLHGPLGFQKGVALKLLAAETAGAADRQALLREARLGAMLSHPNVVGVTDLGEADGRTWIAMELVRGPSLADALRTGPLTGPAALEVGVQVCAALEHVHGLEVDGRPAGLVHRDVKPGNLLLDRSGLVKLADLGIARLQGDGAGRAGTPGYAPPEQLAGREDHRADLFALGMTLLTCVRGGRPLGRGASAARAVAAIEERHADPAFLAPADEAAPGLAAVLHRCLRHDRELRWPSAAELGQALAALRARHRTPAPPLIALVARARPDLDVDSSEVSAAPISDVATHGPPGRLPARRDRLVGRGEEIDEVLGHLRNGPGLTTILGPAGAGKTRVAIEVAHRVTLPGGSGFAELAGARDEAAVLAAVAAALSVAIDRADPARVLGWAMRARGPLVLVLDDCERAAGVVAHLVAVWRELAPEARFLATSRVPLRAEDEVRVPLEPLPVEDGVDLFLARAPVPERELVEEIVQALDGLPLAIELAAARTRRIGARAVRDRLADLLRLLAGGERDRPERQRSLRASLDGSYELLGAWEQAALRQLSVFEGGFTLAAAEATLALGPDAPWAVDLIEALAEASLLRVDPVAGRFRMLAVVQAYAADQLTGDERQVTELRHGRHFAQLGATELVELERRRERPILDELDNLLAAARRAVARGDGSTAVATALPAVRGGLLQRGPIAAALDVLEPVSPLAGPRRPEVEALRADVLRVVGRVDEAEVAARRVIAAAPGTPAAAAACLVLLNVLRLRGDLAQADALTTEALAIYEARGDRVAMGRVLAGMVLLRADQRRLDDALAHASDAEALIRSTGDRTGEATLLSNVGLVHAIAGRYDPALDAFGRAIELHRRLGNRRWAAMVAANRAGTLYEAGRDAEADRAFQAVISATRAIGDRKTEATTRSNHGQLLTRMGRHDEARRELCEAAAALREVGARRSEALAVRSLGRLAYLQGDLDEARDHLDSALGEARALGDGHLVADLGVLLANVQHARGDSAAARVLLDEVLAIPEEIRRRSGLDALLARARIAIDLGELDPAAALCREALGWLEAHPGPERPTALALLAECEVRRGHLDAARAALAALEPAQAEGLAAIPEALLLDELGDPGAARDRLSLALARSDLSAPERARLQRARDAIR